MTACILISPGGVPALFFDALVTYGQPDFNDACLPAHIPSDANFQKTGPWRLARKGFIVHENTAIACAGDAEAIGEFINNCRSLCAHTPTELVYERLTFLAQEQTKVEALIAHIIRGEEKFTLRTSSSNGLKQTTNLGGIDAIGSGRDTLLREFRKYDEHVSATSNAFRSPYDIIHNVAPTMTQKFLIPELAKLYDRSWGGFFEYIYLDTSERKWKFGIDSFYVTILAFKMPDGRVRTYLTNKAFSYSATEIFGKVLSIDMSKEGINFGAFLILDTTKTLDESLLRIPISDWLEWKPTLTSVCISLCENSHKPDSVYINLSGEKAAKTGFFVSEDGKLIPRFDDELKHEISKIACQDWGKIYDPSAERPSWLFDYISRM